ncbi:phosphoribosylformylglycinamidine synthase subunit PurL [Candidatus Oleimmundimicrobium sp.]|uniref:phosphoribosylformylglycinamidine synthase subunit PurL n=1 Tax=Candidatus Oleimmundimicrobium sp. TaxID=3060597 RepID=UPI00271E531F|nr:phosphoribosylformylglycinamidine synthase subunit PurL [Candidatus Oleimmundimicrobium sp.]MDO8885611.1 phosphoribosylformylglycinamidine synthase subunit PurL [Candidatus Oleimmundimicrobium sp.]
MIWRVEVGFKPGVVDALGGSVKKSIIEDLHISVNSVKTVDVYTIKANLNQEQVNKIASELLTDPITQFSSSNGTIAKNFSKIIEVGYKPGVTDNVGRTTVEGIEDLLNVEFKEDESVVHTSRLYLIEGDITDKEAERIATGLLANPIIEHYSIWSEGNWRDRKKENKKYFMDIKSRESFIAEVNLDVDDDELMKISAEGVLSLSLDEMRQIRDYFKDSKILEERKRVGLRDKPTDVELEMLAQTWSEHCKHKIFNAFIDYEEDGKREKIDSLFKTYIKRATEEIDKDWLVSVFADNAGVISFNEDYNLVFKVETHNHPSALDPYGGALTGIVGVNRDPMGTGLGASLIFNTDIFCFGPPDFPYEKLPSKVLHPKRIFKGVRKGVEHGGNKIGIPTVNGTIIFDEAYVYNPLVYCGTGGIMPKKILGNESHVKIVKPGDLIIMVGGRIGKDGIHGATFSSTKLEETTSPTAVQIGAPIVQKKMMDALLEARDAGLYNAITDNGAGGLSSSVGEMAEFCNGCVVDLEKTPTKYPGLDPWEIWVSESQERMTLAVPPDKIDDFMEICKKWDVEATVIGEFQPNGKIHVKYKGKTVLYLNMAFVHEGLFQLKLKAIWKQPNFSFPNFSQPNDLAPDLKRILSSLNVCSKEWVIRQYDHEVQGTSVVKPLVGKAEDGPSDAAVLKLLPDKKEGVVVSNGINPKFGEVDTYWMAASVIDEAIRNCVAVGANPSHIAILDNFCWGNPILSDENPDGDFKLAQLVRAAQGCYYAAVGLGVPFISGKDSFHNEYQVGDKTISIPPTLLISAMGVTEDTEKAVTMDAKREGDLVYILGVTRNELGGSHYLMTKNLVGNSVPVLNAEVAKKLYESLNKAIMEGMISSCHDCSEGGLAVAAAETAFAGGLGMDLNLTDVPTENSLRDDEILFSETNSRFIVTVSPNKKADFERILKGNVFAQIGKVRADDNFKVIGKDKKFVINVNIYDLKEVWQKPLRW